MFQNVSVITRDGHESFDVKNFLNTLKNSHHNLVSFLRKQVSCSVSGGGIKSKIVSSSGVHRTYETLSEN